MKNNGSAVDSLLLVVSRKLRVGWELRHMADYPGGLYGLNDDYKRLLAESRLQPWTALIFHLSAVAFAVAYGAGLIGSIPMLICVMASFMIGFSLFLCHLMRTSWTREYSSELGAKLEEFRRVVCEFRRFMRDDDVAGPLTTKVVKRALQETAMRCYRLGGAWQISEARREPSYRVAVCEANLNMAVRQFDGLMSDAVSLGAVNRGDRNKIKAKALRELDRADNPWQR